MKVYFEERGRGDGCIFLNAYVKPTGDGHGHMFDANGKLYEFAWCCPRISRIYNSSELPKEMWFSIRHGSCNVEIPEVKRYDWTLDDLIYDKIEEKRYRAYRAAVKRIEDVQTIDDFKKAYPLIKKCGWITGEFIYKLFDVCGVSKSPSYNGEIGIAYAKDVFIYKALLKQLEIE